MQKLAVVKAADVKHLLKCKHEKVLSDCGQCDNCYTSNDRCASPFMQAYVTLADAVEEVPFYVAQNEAEYYALEDTCVEFLQRNHVAYELQ